MSYPHKVVRKSSTDYILAVTCFGCKKEYKIAFPLGELIQNVLPTLSSDDRKLLISRTCGVCWKKMFPEGEED